VRDLAQRRAGQQRGIGLFSASEATPLATVREVFETNTFGMMAVTQAVIPLMRESGGTIVNVTSSATFAGMPLVVAYAASKWAIEGFTESLAFELQALAKARPVPLTPNLW